MGDATNLVLILAGELLKRSEHLLTMGLHPSDVILGYEMALEKGRQELECEWRRLHSFIFADKVAMVVQTLSPTPLPTISELAAAIAPSIASKQPGSEKLLSTLAAEAALAVMPKNPKDFNVDTVRVVKVLGGGLSASRVVKGMVFGREAEGKLPQIYEGCKLISKVSSKRLQKPRLQSTLVVSTFPRPRPRVQFCSRRQTSSWTLHEERRSSSRA
jgi:T-complex protein 1 subunit theta